MADSNILAVFGCDHHRVELARRDIDEETVAYEALIDGRPLAGISTDQWQRPGLLVQQGHLILWAGAQLLVALIRTTETFGCETPEEIVDVGYDGKHWYIVSELGVETRNSDLTAVTARYDHGEILLRSRWEGGTVLVTDLQERNLRLTLPDLRPTGT